MEMKFSDLATPFVKDALEEILKLSIGAHSMLRLSVTEKFLLKSL